MAMLVACGLFVASMIRLVNFGGSLPGEELQNLCRWFLTIIDYFCSSIIKGLGKYLIPFTRTLTRITRTRGI